MKYLYAGFPPLAYASASTQRLYVLDAAYSSPRRFFCALYMEYLPSLNKSTYGFCGHKYRPTLRVALIGTSLPAASCFLGRHFLLRENRMMTRKRTPAYWRMSRTMTQSAPIFTWGPCKIVRPCRERRTHRSGRTARSKAQGQHDRSAGCVRCKSVGVLVKRREESPQ